MLVIWDFNLANFMDLKKIKKQYLIVAVVIFLIGGYYWYSESKSADGKTEYVTEAAEKGTLTTSISASGNVVVDSSSNIDPTITGTVKNLSVSVGDKVAEGQFLFELENNDLSLNANKAYASYLSSLQSLESAKANKKEAKNNYDDASSGNKAVMKQKLESAELAVSVAQENIKTAWQGYQNESSDYADRKVTAPISGTVNEINIKNGDDLSKLSSGSSRTVPIIIGDLGTMKAEVEVNEVDIANVSIGQKVMMTFTAIDGLETFGKIEQMDSLGTLESGVVTYNVTISFDTLDSRIKPEMSVSANIITDVKQDVILVPNFAVKTKNGKSYVEVLNSGETPAQIDVKTGASNNTETEILSGVKVGDKIVTQTVNSSATSTSSSTTSSKSSGSNVRVPGVGGFGH